MYENLYEAYTVFEANRLLAENPAEFQRQYANMRHALQRRAKTLEKYGRQYTEGYKKIKSALNQADGKDRAMSFSLVSSAAVAKNTKYSEQMKQEKRFIKNLQEKGIIGRESLKPEQRTLFFKLLAATRTIKAGKLIDSDQIRTYWQKIEKFSRSEGIPYKEMIASLYEFIGGRES